jgi:hypothetical protein
MDGDTQESRSRFDIMGNTARTKFRLHTKEKLSANFNYLAKPSYHKIEHFEGNPQGPSLSLASDCVPFVFSCGIEV